MKRELDFGFGVSVEIIDSETAKIFNLKSNNDNVSCLGVKLR